MGGPLAARAVPRRLQSFGAAPSQVVSAGSSVDVSTTTVRASTEQGSASRRRTGTRAGRGDTGKSDARVASARERRAFVAKTHRRPIGYGRTPKQESAGQKGDDSPHVGNRLAGSFRMCDAECASRPMRSVRAIRARIEGMSVLAHARCRRARKFHAVRRRLSRCPQRSASQSTCVTSSAQRCLLRSIRLRFACTRGRGGRASA